MVMASKKDTFDCSGPLHLTAVDWNNINHRRSIAASLVQGVYVLERDRQENRQSTQALAPPWWEFFNFHLLCQLVDNVDSSIFGAIYEYRPPSFMVKYFPEGCPRYVIAFRGTITKGESISQDLTLDINVIKNQLHLSSRFQIAMQAVRNKVSMGADPSSVWLAGHSLGSAMAMLAGKDMAKMGTFLEAFLFNPPFVSPPIERIRDKKVKHGIRIASSLITAGLAVATKCRQERSQVEDSFVVLSSWIPSLFVNPSDHICSEYIGYFEHREKMENFGAGAIERLATQNSMVGLLMNAIGSESAEPFHLLPSAHLTINRSPSPTFKWAHGIHQWWRLDSYLQSNIYKF